MVSIPRLSLLLTAFALFFSLQAQMEGKPIATSPTPLTPEPAPSITPPPVPINLTSIPFSKLMVRNEPLMLRGARAAYGLTLPISSRYYYRHVTLHIDFTSSITLLDERSQFRVSVNGQVIAQEPLRHLQPEGIFDVAIPDQLLKVGYNKIGLDAAQHYTFKCEDPSAPELWTQVDSENSHVTFEKNLNPIPESLAVLNSVFDSKLPDPLHVNIVTGLASPTDQQLLAGSIVAQGVALRMPFSVVSFTQSSTPVAGMDNIFVGTPDQLRTVMPAQPPVAGAYLQMVTGPDSRYLNLVIGGSGESDVTLAAKTFAQLKFPLPDAPVFAISSLLPGSSGPALVEGGTYPFSDFNFVTKSSKGMHSDGYILQFVMPPDLYANERSQVQITIHFAYGAEMRSDSVINVFLNKDFATAIPLDDARGGTFTDYKIFIPLRSFLPGNNEVIIQPQMMPLVTDFCTAIQEENLYVVLFQDSTISIPQASHFTQVPDLRLFASSGFPLITTHPDNFSVYISKLDPGAVGSAWSILAKISQKAHRVITPNSVSSSLSRTTGSILAVGTFGSFDGQFVNSAPVRLGDDGSIGTKGYRLGEIQGNVNPGKRPLLTSYISPYDSSGVVFLYTAGSPEVLQKGVEQLVSGEYWESLQGDTASWSDTSDSLATESFSSRVAIGAVALSTSLDYYFSSNPILWAGALAVVLLVFLLLTRKLLMKRQKGQH